MPSTVRTERPWIWGKNNMHAFMACGTPSFPVTITEHAPQSPSLQPSLVPQSPISWRRYSSKVSVPVGAMADTDAPFRRNEIFIFRNQATVCFVLHAWARCGVRPRREQFYLALIVITMASKIYIYINLAFRWVL